MLSVVLATCNGEKYLAAQLKSLEEQTLLPEELVVFDDCSVDGTVSVLHEFAKNAPFAAEIHENLSPLGAAQNFAAALAAAKGDYIAFCDQDDVWQKDKLRLAMEVMQKTETAAKGEPVAVHTDLTVVDENLQTVQHSLHKSQLLPQNANLTNILAQNPAVGCTMLINKPLKKLMLPMPKEAVMHDFWAAVLAAAAGKLVYVDTPMVLYRQHGKNCIGAARYFSFSSALRLFYAEKNFVVIGAHALQTAALVKRLRENKLVVDCAEECLSALTKSDILKLMKLGYGKRGKLRNFFYYACLYLRREEIAEELNDFMNG